jgi:hypothetical protein
MKRRSAGPASTLPAPAAEAAEGNAYRFLADVYLRVVEATKAV